MGDGLLNKKVGFVIQARMKSTRLPGKILMPIPLEGSIPLLKWITNALKNSSFYRDIIIATSTYPENDVLSEFSLNNELHCYRGSEVDVLSRFISITKKNDFDAIVRFTGDNPVLDIEALDKTIACHFSSGADYTHTRNLPLGMNFEIFDVRSLQKIIPENLTAEDKEHVTLYFKRSGLFKIHEFNPYPNKLYNNLRLTVDYPSDFLVVSNLLAIGERLKMDTGLNLVDYCLKKYPWIFQVNVQNYQKKVYNDLEEEWEMAQTILEKYEFKKIISLIKKSI